MVDGDIGLIISITSSVLGIIVFITKQFKHRDCKCRLGCVGCSCVTNNTNINTNTNTII